MGGNQSNPRRPRSESAGDGFMFQHVERPAEPFMFLPDRGEMVPVNRRPPSPRLSNEPLFNLNHPGSGSNVDRPPSRPERPPQLPPPLLPSPPSLLSNPPPLARSPAPLLPSPTQGMQHPRNPVRVNNHGPEELPRHPPPLFGGPPPEVPMWARSAMERHEIDMEAGGDGPRMRNRSGNQGQPQEAGNRGNESGGNNGAEGGGKRGKQGQKPQNQGNRGNQGQNKGANKGGGGQGNKGAGNHGNQGQKQLAGNHGNQGQNQGAGSDGNQDQNQDGLNLRDIDDPLRRMEMEKRLATDLRGLLLTQGGQLLLSQVQSALDKLKIQVGHHPDFIKRHRDKFRLGESESTSVHKKWVIATTDLKICERHVSKAGCKEGPTCDALHICKFYLLTGTCGMTQRGRQCKYGHNLDTPHNKALLKDHSLDTLPQWDCLIVLFQRNRSRALYPKTCKFYNNKNGCQKGGTCLGLHVCKHYVLGDCSYGNRCRYKHDLYDAQPAGILKQFGFDTELSQQEIIAELKQGMDLNANYGDSDSVDDLSSVQSGGHSSFSGLSYGADIDFGEGGAKGGRGGRGGRGRGGRGGERGGGGDRGGKGGGERGGRGGERGGRGGERGGRGGERGGRGGERGGKGGERGRGKGGRGGGESGQREESRSEGGERGRGRGERGGGRGGQKGGRGGKVESGQRGADGGDKGKGNQPFNSQTDMQDFLKELLGTMVTKLGILGGNDDASEAGSSDDTASTTSQEPSGQGARKKSRGKRGGQKKEAQEDPEMETGPCICSYFLLGHCRHSVQCSRSHRDLPYQWQFFHTKRVRWVDFDDLRNTELEREFCNPSKDGCSSQIDYADGKRMPFTVHFDAMMVIFHTNQNEIQTRVRRLSTNNAATSPANIAFLTTWMWYWKDDRGQYMKFENESASNSAEGHPDSKKLEERYSDDKKGVMQWTAGMFGYVVDFSRMVQINLDTNKERKIRRRPEQFWDAGMIENERKNIKTKNSRKKTRRQEQQEQQEPGSNERNAEDDDLPSFWDLNAASSNDLYQLVPITKNGPTVHEYEKIEMQFFETLGRDQFRIMSIQRIQNPDLYRAFQFCKQRMGRRAATDAIEEKFLFHGTKQAYIEAICHQGFDFRVSGTTTGTLYGRGSYFAKGADYSRHYTDSHQLFVARVLVGRYTKGEAFYTRPPPKDPQRPHGEAFDSCVDDMKNPRIFVVFSIEQAYPEYLIDFRKV